MAKLAIPSLILLCVHTHYALCQTAIEECVTALTSTIVGSITVTVVNTLWAVTIGPAECAVANTNGLSFYTTTECSTFAASTPLMSLSSSANPAFVPTVSPESIPNLSLYDLSLTAAPPQPTRGMRTVNVTAGTMVSTTLENVPYEFNTANAVHGAAHHVPGIDHRDLSEPASSPHPLPKSSFFTRFYADGEGHFFTPALEVSPLCNKTADAMCTYANFTRFLNCTDDCYVVPTGEPNIQQVYVASDGRLSYSLFSPHTGTTGFHVVQSTGYASDRLEYAGGGWLACLDLSIDIPVQQSLLYANISGFNPSCSADCVCRPTTLYLDGYCDDAGTCCTSASVSRGSCISALPDFDSATTFNGIHTIQAGHGPENNARLQLRGHGPGHYHARQYGYGGGTDSLNTQATPLGTSTISPVIGASSAASSASPSAISPLDLPPVSTVTVPLFPTPAVPLSPPTVSMDCQHGHCYRGPDLDVSSVPVLPASQHFYTDWAAVLGHFYASAQVDPVERLCTTEDIECGRCSRGDRTIFSECTDTCRVVSQSNVLMQFPTEAIVS